MNIVDKVTGNTYTASEFTEFKNEVQNAILASGLSLAGGSVQLKQAIARQVANASSYTENGVADAYNLIAIGSSDKVSAYQDGQVFTFVTTNTNTGASTLAIDGLAAKDLKKEGFTTALAAGDIVAGRLFSAYYRLSSDNFELIDITFAKGLPKNNYVAVAKPLVSNDNIEGYTIGSEWLFQGVLYQVFDVSTGAAVWVPFSSDNLLKNFSAVIFHDDFTTTKFSATVNNTEPAKLGDGTGTTVANIVDKNIGNPNFSRVQYTFAGQASSEVYFYDLLVDWNAGTYDGTFEGQATGGGVNGTVSGNLTTGADATITIVGGSLVGSGDATIAMKGTTNGSGQRILNSYPKMKDHGSGAGVAEAHSYTITSTL